MSGAFSGHLLDSYYTVGQHRTAFAPFGQDINPSQLATHGPMSFLPTMHGSFRGDSSSVLDPQASYMETTQATIRKIALLQEKLNKKLGPEFISQRPGPGGNQKLTYAEGWKIINLANDIFGFNGWSSSVVNLNVDFIDFNEESKRYTIGVTAIVRVTLRDGVHHEDVGFGMLENSKSKGTALDKCKKEAVTDGVKRALRSFGNALGNCLYDKEYAKEVIKMKVPTPKFDKDDLYRRPEFAMPSNGASSSTTNRAATASTMIHGGSSMGQTSGPSVSTTTTSYPSRLQPAPTTNSSIRGKETMKPPPPPLAKPAAQPQTTHSTHAAQPQAQPSKPMLSPTLLNEVRSRTTTTVTAAADEPADPESNESFEMYAHSDDDAMMAAVDMASGIGGPIYPEITGLIDFDDSTNNASTTRADTSTASTNAPNHHPKIGGDTNAQASSSDHGPRSAAGRSSRQNAIAAALAAMDQDPTRSPTTSPIPSPDAIPSAPAPAPAHVHTAALAVPATSRSPAKLPRPLSNSTNHLPPAAAAPNHAQIAPGPGVMPAFSSPVSFQPTKPSTSSTASSTLATATSSAAASSSPSMGGGFNIPPRVKPPTSKPAPAGWNLTAANMKRSADAMQGSSTGTSTSRRPAQGMGLSHQMEGASTMSMGSRTGGETKRVRL